MEKILAELTNAVGMDVWTLGKALGILVVGWVIAHILEAHVRSALKRTSIDDRIAKRPVFRALVHVDGAMPGADLLDVGTSNAILVRFPPGVDGGLYGSVERRAAGEVDIVDKCRKIGLALEDAGVPDHTFNRCLVHFIVHRPTVARAPSALT